ncbi:branched-chain amino acid aminotransferase 2, chloroplastic-like [Gossypium raimondii]|uniref:branched-chain amino acid aminotransferase 2, chloroplastic-like n=1 Tax=Gossypium raimondii TaxID=29730 RepID=UPI00063A9EB7|nr:branched-chain amino acid aminotransferase 2, chloroplastic-like [Gossypium raimondii]
MEEEAKVTWDRAVALSQDFCIFNILEKPMLPKPVVEKGWKKGNFISTHVIKGTILHGIKRISIIGVARSQGFQVEERLMEVDELFDADEVFCRRTIVVVSLVGSITYKGKRVSYGVDGFGAVSQQLYSVLTRLQMGLIDDKMNWTVELN